MVLAEASRIGIEEELDELAEKSVESFVLWRERDEVRPLSDFLYQKTALLGER
jgi:hypothetical protein